MKKITVYATWKSTHRLEVPDDFDGDLFTLDEDILDEIDTSTAELYDWKTK